MTRACVAALVACRAHQHVSAQCAPTLQLNMQMVLIIASTYCLWAPWVGSVADLLMLSIACFAIETMTCLLVRAPTSLLIRSGAGLQIGVLVGGLALFTICGLASVVARIY